MSPAATFESDSPERTREAAAALGAQLEPGEVVLLSGPLGAGKTCFVQGLARGLGVTSAVRSPTFVLLTRYPGRVPLAHLDLYRVEGQAAIEALGVEDERRGAVLAAEWGEKGEALWPASWRVRLEETGEGRRRIAIEAPPGGEARLAAWRADLP